MASRGLTWPHVAHPSAYLGPSSTVCLAAAHAWALIIIIIIIVIIVIVVVVAVFVALHVRTCCPPAAV